MSDSKIDYLNPYATLAQQHKDGLDAIITSIGTGGPGTVSLDDLVDAVYDYLTTVYTQLTSPEGENTTRTTIINAINGYLDNGGSSPYLGILQRVPAASLGNLFDRMFDSSSAARHLKGNAGRQQMVIAIGQADAEYWGNQIATVGSWVAYMSSNTAIDMASMPFWVDAAMFGAQFDYYQVNATDSMSTSLVYISALTGSLAVAAGKMVFGWVPKNVGAANEPIIVSEDCDCNGGAKMMSGELSQIGQPVQARKTKTNWHRPSSGTQGSDIKEYYSDGRKACIHFDYGDTWCYK